MTTVIVPMHRFNRLYGTNIANGPIWHEIDIQTARSVLSLKLIGQLEETWLTILTMRSESKKQFMFLVGQ
ncbi:hypothetical protein HA45_19540 [Pantoea rodasii]|nr:hypothetical protein HA45_19540 [Pantoea rodasii]